MVFFLAGVRLVPALREEAPLFMAPLVVVFFIVELALRALLPALLLLALLLMAPALLLLAELLLPALLLFPALFEAPALLLLPALLLAPLAAFFDAPILAPPSSLSEAFPPRPLAGDTARSAAGTPRFVVDLCMFGLRVAAATPFLFAAALLVRASSFWLGFARPLALLVAVAVVGFFICDDFAIPVFVPIAEPRAPVTRGLDAAAFVLALLEPAGADFSDAAREPEADFTLPAPVITADGFLLPPRAVLFIPTG